MAHSVTVRGIEATPFEMANDVTDDPMSTLGQDPDGTAGLHSRACRTGTHLDAVDMPALQR